MSRWQLKRLAAGFKRTDKLANYGAPKREVMPAFGQAQRFPSAQDGINDLFHLRRDRVTAAEYRASRAGTFQVSAEICSTGCQ